MNRVKIPGQPHGVIETNAQAVVAGMIVSNGSERAVKRCCRHPLTVS
jgi:hypothetical protein